MTTDPALQDVFDRSRQFDRKREAIILGAARCFHEFGFANTSLDQIAQRLNVTKKALYRYIESKNEILFEVFKAWLDVQHDALDAAQLIEGGANNQLSHYVFTYISGNIDRLTPMDRIAGEISLLDEQQRGEINKRRNMNDKRVRAIISAGIEEGQFADCDVRIAVYNLHGAIDWFFKWYREGGSLTRERAIAEVLNVYLRGIEAR